MTYCVALNLDAGLIFAADSRTNAGVDDIGRFGKMRVIVEDGDRVIVTLSAGNLSVSQNALNLLEQRARHAPDQLNLRNARSMFEVATLVGDAMREVRARDEAYLKASHVDPSASFLLGGQIAGEAPRLFLVYSEGNFIENSDDTPFFQTGETKFGKPILDRVIGRGTSLTEATKCVLVSFDSTIRSNLSVGLPIDLLVYRRDSLRVDAQRRIDESDPDFERIRAQWNDILREGIRELPAPVWLSTDG